MINRAGVQAGVLAGTKSLELSQPVEAQRLGAFGSLGTGAVWDAEVRIPSMAKVGDGHLTNCGEEQRRADLGETVCPEPGSGVTARGCGASQAAATAGTRRRRRAAASASAGSAQAWRPRGRHRHPAPPPAHLTAAPVRRKRCRALSAAVLAACARELSIALAAAAAAAAAATPYSPVRRSGMRSPGR